MVAVSAAFGALTLWLLWTNRFEFARYTSGIAVGAILAGWVLAQRPDFLPGKLSLQDAAAGNSTLVVLVLALLVIVPAIAVLFRLTLEGRLPEQFHPIVTVDDRRDR